MSYVCPFQQLIPFLFMLFSLKCYTFLTLLSPASHSHTSNTTSSLRRPVCTCTYLGAHALMLVFCLLIFFTLFPLTPDQLYRLKGRRGHTVSHTDGCSQLAETGLFTAPTRGSGGQYWAELTLPGWDSLWEGTTSLDEHCHSPASGLGYPPPGSPRCRPQHSTH